MANQVLKDELTLDPLARGYAGMTDADAADNLNLVNRDAPANPSAILDYTMQTEFRNASIYGRVALVAALEADPATGDYGNAQTGPAAATVAIDVRQAASARAFIRLTSDAVGAISTPLTNTQLTNLLTELDTNNSACMSISQRDAIIALSQNQQSRATELGLGRVREGHVMEARR